VHQREATESDFPGHGELRHGFSNCGNGNPRSLFDEGSVNAGDDAREGWAGVCSGRCNFKRATIAGGEQLCFALPPTAPNRPDRVNDVSSGEAIALGQLCVAGHAVSRQAAFRPGGTMNRPAYPTAGEQRLVCGVDDGVNLKRGEVGDDSTKDYTQ